jgi:hypothetical protein
MDRRNKRSRREGEKARQEGKGGEKEEICK